MFDDFSIRIRVIPHQDQRYNTVGDYQTDADGNIEVRISDLGDERKEIAIGVHEAFEAVLCRYAGITDKMIDDFDLAFDAARAPGDASEPGDDPNAPYYHQHQLAMRIERMACEELGLDWDEHEARIAEVMSTYPKA